MKEMIYQNENKENFEAEICCKMANYMKLTDAYEWEVEKIERSV